MVAVDLEPRIKLEHMHALPNLRFLRADVTSPHFAATLEAAVTEELLAAPPDPVSPAPAAVPTCVPANSAWPADSSLPRADSSAAAASATPCVAVGMHLCGPLSPAAITLFAASPSLRALLLVPCCLDKRTDGPLKMQARAPVQSARPLHAVTWLALPSHHSQARLLGIDPYEAKVRELRGLLEACAEGVRVSVSREDEMRTHAGQGSEGSAGVKNALIVGRKAGSTVA